MILEETNREKRMKEVVSKRLKDITLVAEGTHLRHNLSAIIRSAESFGVATVHLISAEKNTISGAAKGGERWVNLEIHEKTEQCFDLLKKQGYAIFVADLQEHAYTPDTLPLDRPVAVVMGTELVGVSAEAKKLADGAVILPMYGMTQSLNVSVASACLLYRLSSRMREESKGFLSPAEQECLVTEWKERESAEKNTRQKRITLGEQMLDESNFGEDPLL